MKETRILAWHFLSDDGRLRWGSKGKVQVGKIYSFEGEPVMCQAGMHGSRRLIDALQYAPGAILCRVEIWGGVKEQEDKLVGQYRKVLALADATKMLHLAACHFAEQALRAAREKDKRCWDAIRIKRLWLRGKASGDKLAAAGAAARTAARDAAWAAGRTAARDAARTAARDAARTAAWDAAWDEQNKYMERMANILLKNGAKKV